MKILIIFVAIFVSLLLYKHNYISNCKKFILFFKSSTNASLTKDIKPILKDVNQLTSGIDSGLNFGGAGIADGVHFLGTAIQQLLEGLAGVVAGTVDGIGNTVGHLGEAVADTVNDVTHAIGIFGKKPKHHRNNMKHVLMKKKIHEMKPQNKMDVISKPMHYQHMNHASKPENVISEQRNNQEIMKPQRKHNAISKHMFYEGIQPKRQNDVKSKVRHYQGVNPKINTDVISRIRHYESHSQHYVKSNMKRVNPGNSDHVRTPKGIVQIHK